MQLKLESAFTAPLIVAEIDDDHWRVMAPFGYYSAHLGRAIEVPEGFETDFASVPRVPVVFWLAGGRATRAAVIHDFLYSTGAVPRADADAVFAEAMGVDGQPWWRRGLMWAAVRAFGGSHYPNEKDDAA